MHKLRKIFKKAQNYFTFIVVVYFLCLCVHSCAHGIYICACACVYVYVHVYMSCVQICMCMLLKYVCVSALCVCCVCVHGERDAYILKCILLPYSYHQNLCLQLPCFWRSCTQQSSLNDSNYITNDSDDINLLLSAFTESDNTGVFKHIFSFSSTL